MSAVANERGNRERERERIVCETCCYHQSMPLSLSQPPHHPPPPCSPCQQGARLRKGTHVPNCKFALSQRERESETEAKACQTNAWGEPQGGLLLACEMQHMCSSTGNVNQAGFVNLSRGLTKRTRKGKRKCKTVPVGSPQLD